jgi:hypothetical protein
MRPPIAVLRGQRGAGVEASQRIWDKRDQKQDERRICNDGAVTEADDNPLEAYVRATLALQGYRFDETQIAEIVVQFSRLAVIARTILQCPLPPGSDAAPVFRP